MTKGNEQIMLPWSRSCFVCGEENDQGLNARSYIVGDSIELPFKAPQNFAGWRKVVHGGLVATVLDEVMTWAAIVGSRKPCFSAEFKVRLLNPLPPETQCVARARMTVNKRRIFLVESTLTGKNEKEVFAKAEGRYMIVPCEKMAEFREDFISNEQCHNITDILNPS